MDLHINSGVLKSLTTLLAVYLLSVAQVTLAQNNKETAQQMVEIADEIMRQSLAVVEAGELYITAANMDPDNIRANYMAGTTTLVSINKGAATNYLLKVMEIDSEYRFDLLYKIGLGNPYEKEYYVPKHQTIFFRAR